MLGALRFLSAEHAGLFHGAPFSNRSPHSWQVAALMLRPPMLSTRPASGQPIRNRSLCRIPPVCGATRHHWRTLGPEVLRTDRLVGASRSTNLSSRRHLKRFADTSRSLDAGPLQRCTHHRRSCPKEPYSAPKVCFCRGFPFFPFFPVAGISGPLVFPFFPFPVYRERETGKAGKGWSAQP